MQAPEVLVVIPAIQREEQVKHSYLNNFRTL
jgi:hypothetical protein